MEIVQGSLNKSPVLTSFFSLTSCDVHGAMSVMTSKQHSFSIFM